ncbi:unnamed protein product [Amoebophrya sp. A120]|nr:unnamed protein product [Amoebophrya sp. A120]|eukprot:GSA120T00009318001.1
MTAFLSCRTSLEQRRPTPRCHLGRSVLSSPRHLTFGFRSISSFVLLTNISTSPSSSALAQPVPSASSTTAKVGKSKNRVSLGGIDEVHEHFPDPDADPTFDAYKFGDAHGIVHHSVKNSLQTISSTSRTTPATAISVFVNAMEAECRRMRIGLTLGDQKGKVLERTSFDRFSEVQQEMLAVVKEAGTGNAESDVFASTAAGHREDPEKLSRHGGPRGTMNMIPQTCYQAGWHFNILEFGSHLGDGTLRLLAKILQSIGEQPKVIWPEQINVIATEDNQSWQAEGTKFVREALQRYTNGPLPAFAELPAQGTSSTTKQLQPCLQAQSPASKKRSKSSEDLIHYNPLTFDLTDPEEFENIAPAIHSHIDNSGFDLVIFDHDPPERFLSDLQILVEKDILKDNSKVIVDNMLRHKERLADFREYLEESSWFEVEKFEISKPYIDRLVVATFRRGKWRKALREEL